MSEMDGLIQPIQLLLQQVEAELAQPFLEFGANPTRTNQAYNQIDQALSALRANVMPAFAMEELAQANSVYAVVLQLEAVLRFVIEVRQSGQGSLQNTNRLQQLLATCRDSLECLGAQQSARDDDEGDVRGATLSEGKDVARSVQPAKTKSAASSAATAPGASSALRKFLLARGEMKSNEALKAFFGASPLLRMWQAELPEAASPSARVDGLIDYLTKKADSYGKKGLVLLLEAFQERISERDADFATVGRLLQQLS